MSVSAPAVKPRDRERELVSRTICAAAWPSVEEEDVLEDGKHWSWHCRHLNGVCWLEDCCCCCWHCSIHACCCGVTSPEKKATGYWPFCESRPYWEGKWETACQSGPVRGEHSSRTASVRQHPIPKPRPNPAHLLVPRPVVIRRPCSFVARGVVTHRAWPRALRKAQTE